MAIGTVLSALLVSCCLLSSAAAGIPVGHRPITFGFTVDVTGSMGTEISIVKQAIYNSTYHLDHYKMLGIDHFVLTVFSDPKLLTNVSEFSSLHSLHDKVRMLKATGGGDCPEYGLDGLNKTIEKSLPNSYIFYFSDAGVHESYKASSVAMAARSKNIKIWIIGTGCCSGPCSSYTPYVTIANMTGGIYYSISESKITAIMKYVNYNVRCGRLSQLLNPPRTYSGITSWLDSHPGCVAPPAPPTLPPIAGAAGLSAQLLTIAMASVVATMNI